MAAHKHEYQVVHEVWPDPNVEVAEGDVGAEHDKPYRVEFCAKPDCLEAKRIVELSPDEAQRLGIRIGKIVSDELTLISENASGS